MPLRRVTPTALSDSSTRRQECSYARSPPRRADGIASLLIIMDDAMEIGMRLPDDDDRYIGLLERLHMCRRDGRREEDDAVTAWPLASPRWRWLRFRARGSDPHS